MLQIKLNKLAVLEKTLLFTMDIVKCLMFVSTYSI